MEERIKEILKTWDKSKQYYDRQSKILYDFPNMVYSLYKNETRVCIIRKPDDVIEEIKIKGNLLNPQKQKEVKNGKRK